LRSLAAALLLGTAAIGCGASSEGIEWVVAPTADAAVVVGSGWRSVLPRAWNEWHDDHVRATFWRSPDAACVAGGYLALVSDAPHIVSELGKPRRGTSYIDRDFRGDGQRGRISWRFIGGKASAQFEASYVPHGGVDFHEWRVAIAVGARTVLLASCEAPEEIVDAATPICEAFLANLRVDRPMP
jgi:hypothetical protein